MNYPIQTMQLQKSLGGFDLSDDKSEDDGRPTKPKPVEKSTKRKIARKERQTIESPSNRDIAPQKPTKRRKVASKDINKSGPITKTKRKRLVSTDNSNEEIESLNSNIEPKMKTRKVKTKTETSEKPVKKRRAVKKNLDESKTESNDDKMLDEDKLQNDLVKDFIKEE